MSERGVFAVDRGIFEHDFFPAEPFTEREAWIWMIGVAAYRPYRARVGPARIELARGQLAHSSRFMAERWKWGETSVRRFLTRLKSESMIGFGARSAHAITVITICNYEAFQRVSLPDDDQNGAEVAQERRRVEGIQSIEVVGGGDTRARDANLISDAIKIANEIALIAGHDPDFLPPKWCGAALRVQAWFSAGWTREVMLAGARAAMAKKRDGPPFSIAYFEQPIGRLHAEASRPVPEFKPAEASNVRPVSAARSVQDCLRDYAEKLERDRGEPAQAELRLLRTVGGG